MGLARTSVSYFFSQVLTTILGFVATVYFARVLGADVLGVYFVVMAVITWLTVPSRGIGKAIRKRVSENKRGPEQISAGFLIGILSSVLVATLLLFFEGYVKEYIGEDVILLLILLLIGTTLFQLVVDGLKGQKLVEHAGAVEVAERFSRITGQAILVVLGYQLFGLFYGVGIGLAISVILGVMMYEISPSLPSREDFRSIVSYSKYSWLGETRIRAFASMDTIVLNFFVASSLIGIYEISWNIASFFVIIGSSIVNAIFPEVSGLSEKDQYEKIGGILEKSVAYTGIFVIPGLVGSMVVGTGVLAIYGEEFTQGYLVLLVLVAARGIDSYEGVLKHTLNAINRPDLAFRVNIIFVIMNLLLNVLLVYLFGWLGAAVATALSSATALSLSYYFLKDQLPDLQIPYPEIGKQVLSAAIMSSVVAVLKFLLPYNTIPMTLLLVGIGAILYFGSLLTLSEDIRDRIHLSILINS